MITPEQRQAIIAEAETWLRTPFHHEALVKGERGGVDCGMLLIGVYSTVGVIPAFTPVHYSYQWHLHRAEERYLDYLALFADEIPFEQAGPGDVAIWRLGRVFSHAAIITAWPKIIHAVDPFGVILDDASTLTKFFDKDKKFWTAKGQ